MNLTWVIVGSLITAIGGIITLGGIHWDKWHKNNDETMTISRLGGKMENNDKKMDIGDDSVVMGNVSGKVGNRSVVIGPTDDRGNTIINQPGAYGYGAHAGPGSIAIGAYAGAGADINSDFNQVREIIVKSQDNKRIKLLVELIRELNAQKKDASKISSLWEMIKTSAALNGAIGLVERITRFIAIIH